MRHVSNPLQYIKIHLYIAPPKTYLFEWKRATYSFTVVLSTNQNLDLKLTNHNLNQTDSKV